MTNDSVRFVTLHCNQIIFDSVRNQFIKLTSTCIINYYILKYIIILMLLFSHIFLIRIITM